MTEQAKSALVHAGAIWVLWLLAGLSILSVTVMLERLFIFWSQRDNMSVLVGELHRLLGTQNIEGARDHLAKSPSAAAAVVLAGAVHGTNHASEQTAHASFRGSETRTDGGVDHSRRASMLGGTEWKCPFPPEADADGVDHAVVTVRINVDATGCASNATVMRDAGCGFGREARRCALEKHFEPALDSSGLPRAGTVTINVHFDR